ncbi:interleukin-8-like [Ambystoma mexicanum]|uniref:interleukin-8-like n=1 Tax=Ambystoma mexicanum TaxID=8296 RepID=UPI0037E96655
MATEGKCMLAILAICLLSACVTEGMSLGRMGTELRCQCIKTESRIIHPKHIQTVEMIKSGAHCSNVEVIATLKSGQAVCLDPSAKWVERIIKRILESSSKGQ